MMVRRIGFGMLASIGVLASACNFYAPVVVGSGTISSQSYDHAGFDRLVIDDSIDVTVLQGEGFAVEISADDNVIDLIDVHQRDGRLRIGFGQPMRLQNATLLCVVHMPRLTAVEVNGTSRLTLRSIASSELTVDLSGASQAEGEVFGGHIDVRASGASQAKLSGEATDVNVSVSGASRADLQHLMATGKSTAEASGASNVSLHCTGELSMAASGASSILFTGSPSVQRRDTSGASSIKQVALED